MQYREKVQKWLKKAERIMQSRGYTRHPARFGLTDEEWNRAVKRTMRTPRSCSCYLCKRKGGEPTKQEIIEKIVVQEELN